jgi:hypothetical protein
MPIAMDEADADADAHGRCRWTTALNYAASTC